MHKRTTTQAGFSMIELLVAVVILAVGLLGLAELQITAMKANGHSESIAAAGSIAQRVIEEIADMDDTSAVFDASVASFQPWVGPSGATLTLPGAGTYNIDYTLTTSYQGVTNLCRVVVRVQSLGQVQNVLGNRQRSVTVTALKRAS